MAEIKLEQLTKIYPDGTKAVDALDLEIADGELVVLVGPSGCGKTSALRMVAGLDDSTDGKVGMGEPLSNVDAKRPVAMRAEIARLQRDLAVTTIYVTDDQTEAMTRGDRVAVMRDGVLQQLAPPRELYREPRNLFVAEFIGSPAMNLVGADLERSNGSLIAAFGDSRLALEDSKALAPFIGKRVILGVRPEHIEDAAIASGAPEDRRLAAVVDIREDLGSDVYVHFGV